MLIKLEEYVFNQDQEVRTTSRLIAQRFNKQHKNVIQRLESIECSEEFTRLNFQLSEYLDPTGRSLKEYQVTRDGFMFLVMGFTGKKAAKIKEQYIQAFNQMEQKLTQMLPQRNLPPQLAVLQGLMDQMIQTHEQSVQNTNKIQVLEEKVTELDEYIIPNGYTTVGMYFSTNSGSAIKLGRAVAKWYRETYNKEPEQVKKANEKYQSVKIYTISDLTLFKQFNKELI
jgi:Rha family phage regulatory protein